MGIDWKGLLKRGMKAYGNINPVVSLLDYVFTPGPTFDIDKELRRLQREYARYLQREMQKVNREIANRSKAEQIRRGVYVGSAYAPTYQRLSQQTVEQLQSQLGQMGVQAAQQSLNWKAQEYLRELQQRQQELQNATSQFGQAIGMVTGSYQPFGTGGQPTRPTVTDWNVISYINAYLQQYPEDERAVRQILMSYPEYIPYIQFPSQSKQSGGASGTPTIPPTMTIP